MSVSPASRELEFKQFHPSTCPALSLLLRAGSGGKEGVGLWVDSLLAAALHIQVTLPLVQS